jgi:hypothetical protein
MIKTERDKIIKALEKHYKTDVLYGKGGFFVRNHGFVNITKARKITGIKALPRATRAKSGGYGDYATLRKIAGRM